MSDSEFERLCHAALEGTADDAELAAFRARLREDSAARAEYGRQAKIHALLTWQAGGAATPAAAESKEANVVRPSRWRFNKLAAVAAAIVLGAGALVWIIGGGARDGVRFDVIAASEGSGFEAGQSEARDGFELATGSVTFRLESGAVVEASAPCTLELKDAMHVSVVRGAITVDVGEEAKGFVVDTANARVVDLGTRFGVSVGEEDTDVVVLEGEVEVYKPGSDAPDSKLASLVRGEAVRVNSLWEAKRLKAVAIRGESLAILGGNGTKDPVVTRVTDDINDVGFHRFYSIHPRAMREGMLAYSTHGHVYWSALPGEEMPGQLKGADVVRTFSADRKDLGLKLSLDISAPSRVYVFFDQRTPVPEWLRRDFVKTKMQLRSGPWKPVSGVAGGIAPDESGELFVEYSVWKRELSQPGSVELGPPRRENDPLNRAMYGIAVKPLK